MSKVYGKIEDKLMWDFPERSSSPELARVADAVWANVVAEIDRRRRIMRLVDSANRMATALQKIAEGARSGEIMLLEIDEIATEALSYVESKP